MSDIQWLMCEVKMAIEAEETAMFFMETASASERGFRVQEWKAAKQEARVARQLLAEVAS